jgi:hypothetical protein
MPRRRWRIVACLFSKNRRPKLKLKSWENGRMSFCEEGWRAWPLVFLNLQNLIIRDSRQEAWDPKNPRRTWYNFAASYSNLFSFELPSCLNCFMFSTTFGLFVKTFRGRSSVVVWQNPIMRLLFEFNFQTIRTGLSSDENTHGHTPSPTIVPIIHS